MTLYVPLYGLRNQASKSSATTTTWKKHQIAWSLQHYSNKLILVGKAELQVISIASAVLLHISDDWTAQWRRRQWIAKASVPFSKAPLSTRLKISFYFPDSKNQAVGQKGNICIFTGVSTHFTGWTQYPGNRNPVIYSWQVWSRAETGWGLSLQGGSRFSATSVSSHHHTFDLRCRV